MKPAALGGSQATIFTTPDARLLLTENIQIKHYQGLQGELAEIPTE